MLDRQNNFDFLRLLFSSLVVFSHSFPTTLTPEVLYEWSHRQIDFGALSVNAFFSISGYLVFYSMIYSPTALNYFWKRCLRIFPALFTMLVFTMCLLPLFYTGSKPSVLHEGQYWKYFINNLSLYRYQATVNGIFTDNPIPLGINGSLWTLKYEFTMYLALLLIFPIRKMKAKYLIIATLFIGSYYIYTVNPWLFEDFFRSIEFKSKDFYRLASYFFAGSMLTYFDLKKINYAWIKLLLLLISVWAITSGNYTFFAPITMSVLVILVGISSNKYLQKIPKLTGDLSYGIYIYGIFIQQCILYFVFLPQTQLFIFSYLIILSLAFLSWNLIEKRALQYKKLVQ